MENEKIIHDYENTLNIGQYGEEILDYYEGEIIADVITYIAEASVGTYDYELWDWAKNNGEWVGEAIAEGLYSIDSRNFDLMDLFKAGQYVQVTSDLYADLDDIMAYVLLDNLKDDYINVKRLIDVIDDNRINIDNNRTIQYYIDIVRDEMQEYPMLEIHLLTGTAWTKSILVEGTPHDGILDIIDEYYLEHGDLPVPMYTLDDVLEGKTFKTQGDEWEYLERLEVLPINGGEYYIEGISHIEEAIILN